MENGTEVIFEEMKAEISLKVIKDIKPWITKML